MLKKITSTLLVLFMAVNLYSPIVVNAQQLFSNPFAAQDSIRTQSIQQLTKVSADKTLQSIKGNSRQKATATDSHIIKFKSDIPLYDIYNCLSGYQYKLLGNSSLRLFKVEAADINSLKTACGNTLDSIKKDKKLKLSAVPNDTYYSEQWAIPDIRLNQAWDITKGSSTVKVAVIDSGFVRGHEDLSSNNVLNGYDTTQNTVGVTSDPLGHGTSVTSIIAATTNNALGMAGACWNISVVPLKVADSNGDIYDSDVITALRLAADSGCDVINMSLGGYENDPDLNTAVAYAVSKGCIIVAAAGNEGTGGDPDEGRISYPASLDGVVSVASVDKQNVRSSFSQYNDKIDCAAPGEDIIVAGEDSSTSYNIGSGTSFSAPYVTAVAALAKTEDKTINSAYFEQLIKTTSTDLGSSSWDKYYGWGLVNAYKLVSAAKSPIIMGVEDGQTYNAPVTITFNKGTATLNGAAFESGAAVSADGQYSLVVTDSAGNKSTADFTIGTVSIVVSGIADGASYNHDVTVTFNEGTALLNNAGFKSGQTVSEEGNYQLTVTDPSGNVADYRFVIDKTAPVVSGAADGTGYNHSVTVSFNEGTATLNGTAFTNGGTIAANGAYHLVVTDKAGNAANIYFIIDTIAPVFSTSPANVKLTNNNVKVTCTDSYLQSLTATRNGLPITFPGDFVFALEGSYVITAADTSGNTASCSFVIDKTAPVLSSNVSSGSVTNGNVTINGSDSSSIYYSVTLNGWPIAWPSNRTFTADGIYKISATDSAGNFSSYSFSIDKSAPVIKAFRSNKTTAKNGGYINSSVTVTVTDTALVSKSATLNGKAVNWPSNNTFTVDGKYVITAKDKYNRTASYTFIIDRTPPKVTVRNLSGKTYSNGSSIKKGAVITYSESNYSARSIYKNGRGIAWPSRGKTTSKGAYALTVVDKAGNRATYKFRVY